MTAHDDRARDDREAADELAAVSQEPGRGDEPARQEPTQWYLGDEPIGPMTAELLRRRDPGSQLAGLAALQLRRALSQWLADMERGVRRG